jgi:hypothetical protein
MVMSSISNQRQFTEREGVMIGDQFLDQRVITDTVARLVGHKKSVSRTDAFRITEWLLKENELPVNRRHRLWAVVCDQLGLQKH